MRTAAFYVTFFGYLLFSFIHLKKAKMYNDPNKNVEEQDKFKHILPKKWARLLLKAAGTEVHVKGEENMPEGAVLLVSNHEGNFDIPVLLGSLQKPFGFISKMEVKKIPIVSRWMEVMNCVFMDRKDRRQSIKAIREGIKIVKEGHSIVVFPEGTRSKGGPVGDFKAGSLRLAVDAEAPIVPIAIKGTSDLMEKNNNWIKSGKVVVSVLPAITHDQYKDMETKQLNAMLEEIIKAERAKL